MLTVNCLFYWQYTHCVSDKHRGYMGETVQAYADQVKVSDCPEECISDLMYQVFPGQQCLITTYPLRL